MLELHPLRRGGGTTTTAETENASMRAGAALGWLLRLSWAAQQGSVSGRRKATTRLLQAQPLCCRGYSGGFMAGAQYDTEQRGRLHSAEFRLYFSK